MREELNALKEKLLNETRAEAEPKHYKCEKCKDEGVIIEMIDGYEFQKECECSIRKRNKEKVLKHIEQSGLSDTLAEMTFKNYKRSNEAQEFIYQSAKKTLEDTKWWYLGGRSGCGKTHIATAICGQLIKKGKLVRYMQWRKDAVELKSVIDDCYIYNDKLKKYLEADVLYIDDLFKGNITPADINLAFVLIDGRYKNDKKTIFTTELSINDIIKIDEAIGSRIYEKCTPENVIDVRNLNNYRGVE